MLQTIPAMPGVYRMFDKNNVLLYVGKAKNLKKRVSAYFSSQGLSTRMSMMMTHACHLEYTVTQTEAEALLLESNVIKHGKPRYNVLLRDDKSYPQVRVSCKDDYPRVSLSRGAHKKGDRCFGPYPNVQAARQTMHLLYKLFRLRQCSNSMFKNRSRPCLQYQIKQCSAPCVNYISSEDYAHDVELAIEFLNGNSRLLIERLIECMDRATAALQYEKAARYRDQIQTLREISEQHQLSGAGHGEIDVMACCTRMATACVQVFSVRHGLHVGNRAYYPRLPGENIGAEEILAAFIAQYYLLYPIPKEIVLSHRPENCEALSLMLAKKAGHAVRFRYSVRAVRKQWLQAALSNAEHALNSQLLSKAGQIKKMQSLTRLLGLAKPPKRMECFDVSHTMGEETVASCVVFTAQGACKEAYRLFNIRNETSGDDCAAMTQALRRHYTRIGRQEKTQTAQVSEYESGSDEPSNVLFVDGGKGQLNAAHRVLMELGINDVMLVGIAKGEGRKAGRETLYKIGSQKAAVQTAASLTEPLNKSIQDLSEVYNKSRTYDDKEIAAIAVGEKEQAGFYFVLQMRDEAHRFAVKGHRHRRARKRRRSLLEDISGLGAKRSYRLLRYFGGIRAISRASIEELSKVPGINLALAKTVYMALRNK